MLRNKTLLKIFSLIAAILLWAYVMGEVDPEIKAKLGNVVVHYINTDVLAESDLAVVQEEEVVISVTIKGKRSDVNDIKKTGLTAYVDVTDCREGKNTEKIEINVPDKISVETVSKETLEFSVEELVETEKPVVMKFSGNSNETANEKMPRVMELSLDEITVRGPKSSVEKVTAVRGSIPVAEAIEDESRWVDVEVTPVTEKGKQVLGVYTDVDKVAANIQLLTVRSVDLEVTAENVGSGLTIDKIESMNKVKLVGPKSLIDELEKVEGVIDVAAVTDEERVQVKIDLPEGIYLYDEENPPTAVVTVKAAQ